MNPDFSHVDNNEHVNDKIVLFYMLPDSEVDSAKKRSLFHFMIYKDRLTQVNKEQQSVNEAISYIQGVDGSGNSNLFKEIPDYISASSGTLNPLIIGYVTVTSPFTAKRLAFADIRERGGGI